jgi:hypothetical protein
MGNLLAKSIYTFFMKFGKHFFISERSFLICFSSSPPMESR